MKPVTIVGIVLIALGVVALVYQGFTYTTKEKVQELGPLEAEVLTLVSTVDRLNDVVECSTSFLHGGPPSCQASVLKAEHDMAMLRVERVTSELPERAAGVRQVLDALAMTALEAAT